MKKINESKKLYIIFSLLVFSLTVTFIDAFVHPPYIFKIPIKIIFFLILPMFFFYIYKNEWLNFKKLFSFDKNNLLSSIFIGTIIYSIIVGGFFLVRNFVDFSNVTNTLKSGMGITNSNFIYVSIYISIFNSFLEEFFYRAFGFKMLKKYVNKKYAYLLSPILFSIYHLGMMLGMFDIWFLFLLLIGLFVIGIIFNFLVDKYDNIYPAWFVHMATNFGINTVGFILFGLL